MIKNFTLLKKRIGIVLLFTLISAAAFSQNFISKGNLKDIENVDINVTHTSIPTFADLDSDGDLDLFIGEEASYINVYLNDGNGNFSEAGYLKDKDGIRIADYYTTPAFSDLDGDLDLDLYYGSQYGDIYKSINNGGELSSPAQMGISFSSMLAPAFADLDNDNDLDMYIGQSNGTIHIYLNNGEGIFSFDKQISIDGSIVDLGSRAAPAFADFDGDSDLDLYVGAFSGFIHVLKNEGSGIFSYGEVLKDDGGTDIDVGKTAYPTFADLDNDGDLDLYVGNINGTIKFYLNISEIYPPIPDITNLEDIIIECATPIAPTATDYMGNTITGTTTTAFPITELGTTTVTWTYDDGNGNTSTQTQNFLNDDLTAPLPDITNLSDVTAECEVTSLTAPTATDNCAGVITGTLDTALPISGEGTSVVITWTYDDSNGNTSSQTQNVIIHDQTDPVITSLHNDQAINADDNCEVTLPDYTGDIIATDNCDNDLTIIQSPAAGTTISGTINNITLTATDNAGNNADVTFNVAVIDDTNPVISSSPFDQIFNADDNCEAVLPDYTGDAVATDNCDNDLTIIQSPAAGTLISGTTNEVTLTVTDDAGNYSEVSFNAAVIDNTDPKINSIHNDVEIQGDENCEATYPDFTGDVIATDNCDADLDIVQSPAPGISIPGSGWVTLTVTDDAGRYAEVTFNVTIVDNRVPEIISTHNDLTIYEDANCEVSLADYTSSVGVSSNCYINLLNVTQSPAPGTIISGYTNEITLTAHFDDGSSSEVSFNIAIFDFTDPVITSSPNDQIISADVNCEATLPDYTTDVIATDMCDPDLTITQSPVAGTIILGATNAVTLTATDDVGNSADVTFNVAVVDNTNPVISSISDQTIIADANCEATLPDYTSSVTASDNCDASLMITQSPIAGTTISGATNAITLTATDDAGNSAQVTFNVAVIDDTNPVISSPGDQTINTDANCEAALPDYSGAVTASDNCDASLTITQSPVAGTIISGAINAVTLTATDDAGNSAQVTFNVAVIDDTNPVISSPGDQTISADANCETALPDYTSSVTSSDNCDASLTITQSPVAGTTISGETNAVMLTATDDAGNSADVTFNVVVIDDTNPVITCVENQTFEIESSASVYTTNGSDLDPVSTSDNCSIETITNDFNNNQTLDGAEFNIGTTTVVWTVTDKGGNTSQCSFDVTVNQSTGIQELEKAGIKMYPNPTNGFVYFETENTKIESIKVYDLTGKLLLERSDLERQEIDLAELVSGVYLVNIRTKNRTITSRIIKN